MSVDGENDFSTNKDVYSIIQDIVEMNKNSFDTVNSQEDNEDLEILSVTVDEEEESSDENSTITSESEQQDLESEVQDQKQESEQPDLESDSDEYELDSQDEDISNESIKLKETTNFSQYKNFSKSKWNKMRKDELLDVINNLKLNVGKYQNKKKSEVIKDIIQTISSQ